MDKRVAICRLATGIPGFDDLMGGGVAEFSFNVITGSPGSGKTTLAHQIMFSLATPQRRALFFTVIGEPPLKMLRYQQQFDYFDFDKLENSIRFVNLAADMADRDFDRAIARIIDEVQEFSPSLVFLDSFCSVLPPSPGQESATDLQYFIQQLGMQMTSWHATTFLMGEYPQPEAESGPVFTVADGILRLSQVMRGDTMVRRMQVVKIRGGTDYLGTHSFRIDRHGVRVFPRLRQEAGEPVRAGSERLLLGVPELDRMLGGGLPAGCASLLVGPPGCGKTEVAIEFLAEGARASEAGILVSFERSPLPRRRQKLRRWIEDGKVGVITPRAPDLSSDEVLHELVAMIKAKNAKRVVIDSLSGFKLALPAISRHDFRQALYRMVPVLTGMGVTLLMTAEPGRRGNMPRFGSCDCALLADAIIMQGYVELDGQLRRVISVLKVRGSDHSKDVRFFDIVDGKPSIGERLQAG